MATIIWLLVWLIKDTPSLQFGQPFSDTASWNNWAIALTICLVIDLISLFRV